MCFHSKCTVTFEGLQLSATCEVRISNCRSLPMAMPSGRVRKYIWQFNEPRSECPEAYRHLHRVTLDQDAGVARPYATLSLCRRSETCSRPGGDLPAGELQGSLFTVSS